MKKVKKVTKLRAPNMLFPGLPNYKGPDKGWFAWVHHGKLFEHTNVDGDSIAARVEYVQHNKPRDERRIRLAHIMYLGKALGSKLTKIKSTLPPYERIDKNSAATKLVMDYIAEHKPRNKWNPNRGSLIKADGNVMGG